MLLLLALAPYTAADLVVRPEAGFYEQGPSAIAVALLYPPRAASAGREGVVVLSCKVTATRTLDECVVDSEIPGNQAFGLRALMLPYLYRVREGAPIPADRKVRVKIEFKLPRG